MEHKGNARRARWAIGLAAGIALSATAAQAATIPTNVPGLSMSWNNNLEFSQKYRLHAPSKKVASDVNFDDGDRNFAQGLASNRFDLLSQFNLHYHNFAMRVSGHGYFDTLYWSNNTANNSPNTYNAYTVSNRHFPHATRVTDGRNADLLDAFVQYSTSVGSDGYGTVRIGQQSVLYGQTIFFGQNGIANAQGPVYINEADADPDAKVKEIVRPVPQIVGSLAFGSGIQVGAYFQPSWGWKPNKFPGVGSYFSTADFLGPGAETFLVGPPSIANVAAFYRMHDMTPDTPQFGAQVNVDVGNWGLGAYAARYNAKSPVFYFYPGLNAGPGQNGIAKVGQYQMVYPENIRMYGVSATRTLWGTNVAAELSMRTNAPLVSDPQFIAPNSADNSGNPAYAVGKSLHLNVNDIWVLGQGKYWDGGSLIASVAVNHKLSITKNPGALDPNTTPTATAVRVVFTPQYTQVLPQLDISIPIGVGYNVQGRSSTVSVFNGGWSHAGDFTVGLHGDYAVNYHFGIEYHGYIGHSGSFLTPVNGSNMTPVQPPELSFANTMGDRDFISVFVSHDF